MVLLLFLLLWHVSVEQPATEENEARKEIIKITQMMTVTVNFYYYFFFFFVQYGMFDVRLLLTIVFTVLTYQTNRMKKSLHL